MKKFITFLISLSMLSAVSPISTYAEDIVKGDVNNDGAFNLSDIVLLQKWIVQETDATLTAWSNGDLNADNQVNIMDLCLMKQELLSTNMVYVTNTEELKTALLNATASDEIVLAPGEYVYSGSTAKGYMFQSSGEGTEENPIIIRSEDPDNPAILSGNDTSVNCVFTVWGDYWKIENLKFTNGQKGVLIENSNYTEMIGCEIYNIGEEAIHIRDNSSYGVIENCYIHDTGLVVPGSGEGIYVGSAYSTTGYGYQCDYNTIRNCQFGPNVAAEHVDIKEYTTGTIVEDCTFDGTGMSGENYAKAFVNMKGNDCILRNNTGYRNGCTYITRAFEQNDVVEGWGQNSQVYGNTVYMDTATNSSGGKMYFLNAWDCSTTVWDNYMAYDGDLFSVDNEADHWSYYNCNLITYKK